MKKKNIILITILLISIFSITSLLDYNKNINDIDTSQYNKIIDNENINELNTFYHNETIDYKISSSDLIDTYVIACAINYDFKSNIIVPRDCDNFSDVKEFYTKYKDHDFIRLLSTYLQNTNTGLEMDLDLDILQSIVSYLTLDDMEEYHVNKNVFKDKDELLVFINALEDFYYSTNSELFFVKNKNKKYNYSSYINNNIDDNMINNLFEELYLNVNGQSNQTNNDLVYLSILSEYRPYNASTMQFFDGDTTYLISFQSYGIQDENPNIDNIIDTLIHETLHVYINPIVAEMNTEINVLCDGQNKYSYGGNLYENMPWARIVDENFVRIIQYRIYRNVYNNEDLAYDRILRKEIEFGGFSKLPNLLKSINDFEKSNEWNTSEFIQSSIKDLFM